jgi:hypothetical protein
MVMRGMATWALALAACNVLGGIESAEPECSVDGRKHGRETDIDCGGPCAPCADQKLCIQDSDCANRACDLGVCMPPLCYDGRQNGSETDIDCGGESEECERCIGDDHCLVASDCAAGVNDPEACQNGICRSLCCYYDCEGCDDCPDVCAPMSLGQSCEVEDCLDPFWCIEDDAGPYLCL